MKFCPNLIDAGPDGPFLKKSLFSFLCVYAVLSLFFTYNVFAGFFLFEPHFEFYGFNESDFQIIQEENKKMGNFIKLKVVHPMIKQVAIRFKREQFIKINKYPHLNEHDLIISFNIQSVFYVTDSVGIIYPEKEAPAQLPFTHFNLVGLFNNIITDLTLKVPLPVGLELKSIIGEKSNLKTPESQLVYSIMLMLDEASIDTWCSIVELHLRKELKKILPTTIVSNYPELFIENETIKEQLNTLTFPPEKNIPAMIGMVRRLFNLPLHQYLDFTFNPPSKFHINKGILEKVISPHSDKKIFKISIFQ